MFTALRMAFCTWSPWEKALTDTIIGTAGSKTQTILRKQLAAINKVQRILGWREIDLYVIKGGRVDRTRLPRLFDDREFVLAKVVTQLDNKKIFTTVSCVGGFLFSFDSDQPIRPIAFRPDLKIEVLEFDRRFA